MPLSPSPIVQSVKNVVESSTSFQYMFVKNNDLQQTMKETIQSFKHYYEEHCHIQFKSVRTISCALNSSLKPSVLSPLLSVAV